MPTYQYECTSCGHQFELFQSFSDEPIKICQKCNSAVKKVYSAVGVVFKGSGFYKTDSVTKKSETSSTSGNSSGNSSTSSSGSNSSTGGSANPGS